MVSSDSRLILKLMFGYPEGTYLFLYKRSGCWVLYARVFDYDYLELRGAAAQGALGGRLYKYKDLEGRMVSWDSRLISRFMFSFFFKKMENLTTVYTGFEII